MSTARIRLLAAALALAACQRGVPERARGAGIPLVRPGAAAGAPAGVVWAEDGLTRVAEDDPPGALVAATIAAARGEYEPFQIVVRAGSSPITDVVVTASDLAGPGGRVIPATQVALFREVYIPIRRASYDRWRWSNRSLGSGRYADALVPFRKPEGGANPRAAPFALASGMNQPIWVEVLVPRDAAPGVYQGTVTVASAQGAASVPVALQVWDFELPRRPFLKSCVSLNGETYLQKRYQEVLLEHRLSPRVVQAQDAQDLMDRAGLQVSSLRFWPGNNAQKCFVRPAPAVAALREQVDSYPPGLELFAYIADSIQRPSCLDDQIRQWARNVHQTRAKTLIAGYPIASLLDDGTGRPAADIWAGLPAYYKPADPAFQEARRRGNEFWSYTALAQDGYSPKWLIDYAPINYRISPGFISQSLDLAGILYWTAARWDGDPWNGDMAYVDEDNVYQGEGLLLYPGGPAGVDLAVPSMRLKWVRDGIDDYDYVELLKRAGRGDLALEVARSVGRDWRTWTRDPAALQAARRRLGEELDRLHGRPGR